uniref:ATP synthase complex subunit 8 n=1 Tax=Stictopleurus subviridis TaxID=319428 RepID=C6F034_9HEMI|nr:ATP synthase F0 subunit 8 [Stictopleurus subviridis]YP_010316732.1 ATP synthase F0 subunit 8 [Liorhyssus hyalinus]ACF04095.1 ATP synthase F0 subunit 8 [Stictopleurus subviridis]UMY76354.1 ATP synthase F0 subunit 8 [Liorhyssus hyalinus]URN72948.1 ATP synthase F0 subunit 8 [Liorhyssus hyalinus]
MPQMSPLWWEILFLLFIMCFLIMNTIIYYNKMISPKKSENQMMIKTSNQNWKW